jgi:hypothetical protein
VATPGGSGFSPAGAGDAFEALAGEIGAVVGALTDLVGVIKPFVAAISPSTILEFNQAVRDLMATVGSGFISFFNVISSVVREISGVLLPVMQQLEPVFRSLAEAVGDQLLGAAKLVAAALDLLAPVLQVVADVQKEYSKFLLDLVSVVVAVARVFKELLVSFFGGGNDIQKTFKEFIDVIRQVVKSLVTFAATLAVFAGFRDTVGKFAAALAAEAKARDERAAGLKAAATNPQITDIASILRQQQQAAFIAAGGGAAREKSDTEWLKEIAESVKGIAGTKKSFGEAVSEWWHNEVIGGSGILGKVLRFVDNLSVKIAAFFNRIW